jgi:Ca2+-binding RTX toxin-like protein
LLGGHGNDTIIIEGASGNVIADGEEGSDTVLIRLGALLGPFSATDTGSTGTDTLIIQGADTDETLSVTLAQITSDIETVSYAGFETLTLDTGAGDDTVTVSSTASIGLTVLNSGGADSTLIQLGNLAGDVTLEATGTGTTAVQVLGTAGDDVITLTPSNLAAGSETILFTFAPTSLAIDAGPGSNQVDVQGSPTPQFTVTGVSPDAVVTGPSEGVRGQVRSFLLSASDPNPGDEAVGFTYAVNFGDGSPLLILPASPGNGAGVSVEHIYTEAGTYTIEVTATDQENLTSTVATHTLVIAVIGLQDGGATLAVGGTLGDDDLLFRPGSSASEVEVVLDGVSLGVFTPTGKIEAFGQAGDDTLHVTGNLAWPAWLYGQEGNDRLKGGASHDVLLGGAGDDLLVGGSGRDLLLGGEGADRIVGNADDDLLIAGYFSHEGNEAALVAILAEWTSDRDYDTRVANLRDGSGSSERLNDDFFLQAGTTVFDDDSEDVLTGSAGLDWFLFDDEEDRVTGLDDDEFADDLDFILGP